MSDHQVKKLLIVKQILLVRTLLKCMEQFIEHSYKKEMGQKIKENDDKCFALVKGSNIIVIFMIIIAIFFVCQTE